MVDVRPARPGEFAAILDLWHEAGSEPGVTDDIAALHALDHSHPGALLAAVVEGELVGTIIATWDGWRASIYRLAVRPAYRRRSIARTLLAEAERSLQRAGARRVNVIVLNETEPAIGFWGSAGYQHDERVRRYVRNLP